ncbi:uncharacterized protein LOC134272697 [Saccostrea cucullata]|uniref:uncharacterized protein LOC134272697 n=1 Tax=Saccostrea cuccullata TaxID=36930 RepID=UPI002ED2129D
MSNLSVVSNTKHNGYDLDVYGRGSYLFYSLHIPALICITCSFISAVTVLVLSFKTSNYKTFFKWTKSERFIVYLAICDGSFNLAHFTDHFHILVTRDHVYPKALCQFYGLMLAEFITAQNLLVNIVAINAFLLMYFNRNLEFGTRDYRLLLWTFGLPLLGSTIAALTGQLGPNGTFCYFDGVTGNTANFFFTTVPLCFILLLNTTLYILIFQKLTSETRRLRRSIGTQTKTLTANHNAARSMSLFVLAFIIQWWAMAVYGLWTFVHPDGVPTAVFHFVTTFSNIGGILNFIVFIIIRKRSLMVVKISDATNQTNMP